MKRRNWVMLVLLFVGITSFILSRTVWGPPSKAGAAESEISPELTQSERRYIQNQPSHWKKIVITQN